VTSYDKIVSENENPDLSFLTENWWKSVLRLI